MHLYVLTDGYSRAKNPETRTFRAMTPTEALSQSSEMYFTGPDRKSFRRCRVNGAPKTWKTRENVELPVKYGMYEAAHATSIGSRETGEMHLPNGGLLLVEVQPA